MANEQPISIRLPAPLAEAVRQRAAALSVHVSDVVKEGCVRAVSAPLDRRSKAYVQLWLDAQETDAPAAAQE